MTERVLTGIKPTGSPHVGNLLGAIRPALRLAKEGVDAMYFIADYHALINVQDAKQLAHLTHEVAATWLALGLDPAHATFYRQSDIAEIFELSWILTCFTSKGWMNKAHAYKAAIAKAGETAGADPDAGISMGLYSYPVLMAADILCFDVDLVPVGKDQVQHIEIARDIAQRLNHVCGAEVLKLPRAKSDDSAATVIGIDGKKMSKSYDNTLPLFATPKQLAKQVGRIVTDSLPPDAPKDPDSSFVFQIYRAVATPDETAAFADRLRAGMSWGDAKKTLAERLTQELGDAGVAYDNLMKNPERIDALLAQGAAKARVKAREVLERVRRALGLSR